MSREKIVDIDKVLEMRESGRSVLDIANDFGVAEGTIRVIVSRCSQVDEDFKKRWRKACRKRVHVEDAGTDPDTELARISAWEKNISSVVEMIRLGATDDEIVTSVKDMTRFALDDIKKTELQKYGFGFSQNLIDPQYARVVSRYLFDSGLVGVKKAESIEKRIGAGAVRYYQLATWIGGTDNTQWLIQKSVYGLVENTRMLDELHMERTQRY